MVWILSRAFARIESARASSSSARRSSSSSRSRIEGPLRWADGCTMGPNRRRCDPACRTPRTSSHGSRASASRGYMVEKPPRARKRPHWRYTRRWSRQTTAAEKTETTQLRRVSDLMPQHMTLKSFQVCTSCAKTRTPLSVLVSVPVGVPVGVQSVFHAEPRAELYHGQCPDPCPKQRRDQCPGDDAWAVVTGRRTWRVRPGRTEGAVRGLQQDTR